MWFSYCYWLQKFLEETEEKVEPDLRPDVLERNWNQLLALHQERDAAIHKKIKRLERIAIHNSEDAAAKLKNQTNVTTVCHFSIMMVILFFIHYLLHRLRNFYREFVASLWLPPDSLKNAWIKS